MFRWGILSTGTIARNFAETCAKMDDVAVQAVASRDAATARAFADEFGIPTAHGSYEALAADPEVDIVYIATPHSRHFEDMKRMIDAGKHILCEKSFTTDARQAEEIIAYARERGVFVMEAFWTKLIPLYRQIEQIVRSGEVGELRAVTAQYGYTTGRMARKFDAQLAGGTLLDIGVYAIGFACMFMGYAPERVVASMVMNDQGTDATDAVTLHKDGVCAQLITTIGANIPTFGALYGTKGHIDIPDFKNPQRAVVCVDGQAPREIVSPFEINGFEYEIREAQACAAAGRGESAVMTHENTVAVMRIMDEVRRQCGLVFPFEA